MHVHELNPSRTTAILIIFVVIIVIGLLTIRNPRLKYALSPEITVATLTSNDSFFYPEEIDKISNTKNSNIILFDIRNNFAYGRGHIPGAENVSAVDLLSEEIIERLKEMKLNQTTVVLYANNQLEANGPWLVLRQLGFDNVKVLLGGYDYYSKKQVKASDSTNSKSYLLGFARFNFAEIMSSSAADDQSESSHNKLPVTIERKKKSSLKEGGC